MYLDKFRTLIERRQLKRLVTGQSTKRKMYQWNTAPNETMHQSRAMNTKDKASLSKSHLIRTDIYYWYSEGMFACAYGTQIVIIIPLSSPSSRRRFVILSYQYRKTVSRLFTGTNLIYCPSVNHTVHSQTLNHSNRENEITTSLWNLNWSCNIVYFF